jgi:exopolysaccharide production protein ExoZ
MQSPTSSAAPRLPFLDALRGYAILAVIAVHTEQASPLASPIAKTYAQNGRYGVQLFFIVSAVSIAMAWHARQDGYLRFLVRRLFRLLPALSLAVIGYAAINGVPKWWQAAMTLTFVNGLHPAAMNSAVPGSWTLSSEMMFYLAVPVLAASIRSLRAAAIWLVGAELVALTSGPLVYGFWMAVNPDAGGANADYFGMSIFVNARWFIAGWATWLLMQRPRLSPRASRALLCLAIACLAAAPLIRSATLHDLAFMFGFSATLYAMACGAGAFLDNAVMRWLGTVSYSIYLWHFVVWNAGDWPDRPAFLPLLAGTLALSTLCASLTYALVERPGIRLGAALLRGRFARPAARLDTNTA